MSEELDNKLRERISEVFEHYEDTSPAQEGWLLLREKFPEEKKRRIAPIWWSVAAMLLVLCLFGVWFLAPSPQKNEEVIAKQKPVKNRQIKPATTEPTGQATPKDQPPTDNAVTDDNVTGTDPLSGIAPNQQAMASNRPKTKPNATTTLAATTLTQQRQNTPAAPQNAAVTRSVQDPANQTIANNAGKAIVADGRNGNALPDSSAQDQRIILAQQTTKERTRTINAAIVPDSVTVDKPASRMETFLANEQKKEEAKKQKADKTTADKRVLYSIYAATYFNYAEGSKSQMNTGAGFSTDLKLSRNFKLSTGLAIARNTLSYNGQPTQSGILNEGRQANAKNSANDAVQFSAGPSGAYNTALGVVALRVVPDAVISGYNVSLTGLDLPINLKYEFNPAKTDSYISAGLSSGTFINETFNYSYSNSANTLGSSTTIPDASVRKSFASFDFARTLNLSVGMGYQITKGNRLVIEPFLKYPLSGVGSQQLRFGAGGINLRLKFQTWKK